MGKHRILGNRLSAKIIILNLIFVLFGFQIPSLAQPVVPGLNSNPEILSMIDELPENNGVWLPNFNVIGDGLDAYETFATEGPGIRDYCLKWVYSQSRERALYAGGNHQVPHNFNDVWEFDLSANTWVLLHQPDPGIKPVHTWWGLTYDQGADKLYWMSSASNISQWVWPKDGYAGPPLRVYDPFAQNGWDIVRAPEPRPGDPNSEPQTMQGGTLEYIRDHDVTIWYGVE